MEEKQQNYRFLIQYEGSRYSGWQKLGGKEQTIQGKLENILERMTGEAVTVIGSGRTDAGVHAKGQVANAHLRGNFSEKEILDYVNGYLPEDIAVLEVTKVSEEFHSRYHAVEKCYLYRLSVSAAPDVFQRRYVYEYGRECLKNRAGERQDGEALQGLDLSSMKEAAAFLVGEHDFQSFCGRKMKKKSSVRNIRAIEIEERDGELQFLYRGDGFLFHMIRIMTGTLLEVGEGKRQPEDMKEILASGIRENAGRTMPAKGLTLLWVRYGGEDGIGCL